MGIPVRLITDGMPAHLMSQGLIDKFISAADRITLDGHITNKVAPAQRHRRVYYGIPFYVLGYDGPDPKTPTASDIEIEQRNPTEVFYRTGVRAQCALRWKALTATIQPSTSPRRT